MTYCVGLKIDRGLVFASDTRTNAGVDNVARFKKMKIWDEAQDRTFVLLSAGNLAVTQAVVTLLDEQMTGVEEGQQTLNNVPTMFQAARLIGAALRRVREIDGESLGAAADAFSASFVFGGQIRGEPPRLFQIYQEGNFIEATKDTAYFQIGEHKYGKPVLDRAISYGVDLYDALKIGLISMDSTMRSNLGVGMPIDIVVARRDACDAELSYRIEPGEPYFHDLRERWSAALRAAHIAIPRPPYAGSG